MSKEKNKGGAPIKEIKWILSGWDTWETDLDTYCEENNPTDEQIRVFIHQSTGKKIISTDTFKRRLDEVKAKDIDFESIEYRFLVIVSFSWYQRMAHLQKLMDQMIKGEIPSYGFNALNLAIQSLQKKLDKHSIEVQTNNGDTSTTIKIGGEDF